MGFFIITAVKTSNPTSTLYRLVLAVAKEMIPREIPVFVTFTKEYIVNHETFEYRIKHVLKMQCAF
jgi:hypothetical protein